MNLLPDDTEEAFFGPEIKDDPEEEDLYEHFQLTSAPGQMLLRLDVFLSTFLKNTSRSRIKNATLSDGVRVNGIPRKASYKVKPGDQVSVLLPYPPPPEVTAENIPLNIIYEDEQIILVNKSPGMVVHPGVGNHTGTLIHALLWHFKDLPPGPGLIQRPGLVHRIDKDTSGLLVIAKTEFALSFLAQQFYDHSCARTYHAIVWGDIPQDTGTIIGHIGRSTKDRKIFMVYPDGLIGKPAITHYEVIERFGFATYIKCKLETGRTHQIRVHLKHIGHTLFGDYFYGGDQILSGNNSGSYSKMIKNALEICPRQSLHAKTLGFIHPGTQNWIEFNSELPEDFNNVLLKFRNFIQGRN
ncbi:MAG: RluA family pseudouridine synthase [Sphingobacteriia bacterium]|nr:RluA family pseudouridine synthase [Sphingobacteriia bacterium]